MPADAFKSLPSGLRDDLLNAYNEIVKNFTSGSAVAMLGSSDTIDGGEGADVIYGNTEEISVVAAVSAEVANNIIYGGEGADTIYGGARIGDLEATSVVFSGGDDYIDAGVGDDTVFGDLETVVAGHGATWSSRGNGDTIHGGVGDDALYGDVKHGADALISVDGGFSDTIDGGPDGDAADGGPGEDTCTNVETITDCNP